MKYYPINVDVKGRSVVVIGGGKVAHQKIVGLLQAGARVHVISPLRCPEIEDLAREGRLQITSREYREGDVNGALLVFGATNQPQVHQRVHEEARNKGVFFNAVDEPQECDFTVPARVERGELLFTISTGGEAPFLSKALRKRLEQLFGPECEDWVFLLGRLRERLKAEGRKDELLPFFEEEGERLLGHLRNRENTKVDEILKEHFGAGFSLLELGLESKER